MSARHRRRVLSPTTTCTTSEDLTNIDDIVLFQDFMDLEFVTSILPTMSARHCRRALSPITTAGEHRAKMKDGILPRAFMDLAFLSIMLLMISTCCHRYVLT
jgi:hypothetical protein